MEVMDGGFVSTTVVIGLLIGASVFLLFYILNLLKTESRRDEKGRKNEKSEDKRSKEPVNKGKKGKAPEGRWNSRSDKQAPAFSHPWLLTSLKGHTAQVLDMDFASNGKYLASSAEEDPSDTTSSSSGSDSNPESTPPPSASPSPSAKGLSRRQRKNRRRDDHSPSVKKPKAKPRSAQVSTGKRDGLTYHEKRCTKLFNSYTLSPEQRLTLGYPMESSNQPGHAIIFKSPINFPSAQSEHRPKKIDVSRSLFNVNAQDFVPGMEYAEIRAEWCTGHDSGQGSGNSSDSGENLDESEGSDGADNAQSPKDTDKDGDGSDLGEEHQCVRCRRDFLLSPEGSYVTQEECHYHWAKLEVTKPGYSRQYACCRNKPDSKGCTVGKGHVWSGVRDGFSESTHPYVHTPPRRTEQKAYALDCEMCYTSAGLEVTKVTVISMEGRLVYDTFIRPDREVIDYNTRFSGITAEDLCRTRGAKNLAEVQKDLLAFVSAETILIGHGLENDLRVLRIIHNTIVDTAVAFPHPRGLPYRLSLKSLVAKHLGRDIQTGASGHSSYEDACACLDLIMHKVHTDFGSLLALTT